MKPVPMVVTGLATLAVAAPSEKRQAPVPTREQLCVGFNNDFAKCQQEAMTCIKDLNAKGSSDWDQVTKCLDKKRPGAAVAPAAAAAAPAAAAPAPAAPVAAAPAGAAPTREQLCVGFNNDFAKCQQETMTCIKDLNAKGSSDWDQVTKCLDKKRPGAAVAPGAAAADAGAEASFKADIRVDTNRDGVVDVEGSSDEEGKNNWTDASGAIFLANIGDSGGRCRERFPQASTKNLQSLFDTLGKCHDADDDTQRAPQFMAPMRTKPIPGLSNAATGSVTVSDSQTRGLVRIFRATQDGGWEIVNNDTVFSAEDLKQGLTLGIDARDTRRPGGWDGRASVDFTVKDGGAQSKDTVMLRVAPVLLQHHLQPIQKVLASDLPNMKQTIRAFTSGLHKSIEGSMEKSQVPIPITVLPTDDVWAQDYLEPAYMSMPGEKGTAISMRLVLEGRHFSNRNSTGVIYTDLRGEGVGGLATGPRPDLGKKDSTFNAGGNIETIPPYELNGVKFPAGRVIVGGDATSKPSSLDFFQAQEMQTPIVLDSTWLTVKHVDEMIQAVPAKSERGWAVMVVDPQMGLQLLREAENRGFGGEPVINREKLGSAPTITEFLKNQGNIQAAEISSQRMKANIELLKKETGITDADIIQMPSLIGFKSEVSKFVDPRKLRRKAERRQEAEDDTQDSEGLDLDIHGPGGDSKEEPAAGNVTVALERRQAQQSLPVVLDSWLPSLVNGLTVSDKHYVAPKPYGPMINGKDFFELVAADKLQKAGFETVDFYDDWMLHTFTGDLHCFTNTFRDASKPWWQN